MCAVTGCRGVGGVTWGRQVNVSRCLIGAPGTVVHSETSLEVAFTSGGAEPRLSGQGFGPRTKARWWRLGGRGPGTRRRGDEAEGRGLRTERVEGRVSRWRREGGAWRPALTGREAGQVEDGDGFAYVGVDAQGRAVVQMEASTVQLTQLAGVRVGDEAEVRVERSRLLHTGCMGGAGVLMRGHGRAVVRKCWLRPGGSMSPIWNIVSAAS